MIFRSSSKREPIRSFKLLSGGRILDVMVLGSQYLFEGLSLLGGKSLSLLLDMRCIGLIRKRTIKTC